MDLNRNEMANSSHTGALFVSGNHQHCHRAAIKAIRAKCRRRERKKQCEKSDSKKMLLTKSWLVISRINGFRVDHST